MKSRRRRSTWRVIPDDGDNFRWEASPSPSPSMLVESTPPCPLPCYDDVSYDEDDVPCDIDVVEEEKEEDALYSMVVEDSVSGSDSDESDVGRRWRRRPPSPLIRQRRPQYPNSSYSNTPLSHDYHTPNTNTNTNTNTNILKGEQSVERNVSSSPNSMFQTGSGEPSVKGNGFSSPNSMFQTGSGKTVHVSSAGLHRAKSLLGVQDDHCTVQGFGSATKKFNVNDKTPCATQTKPRQVVANSPTENNTSFEKAAFHFGTSQFGNEPADMADGELVQEMYGSGTEMPPVKFHTAGGRSISVSNEALQRARSLLGDPDMDGFSNEGDAGASMFSFLKGGNSDGNSFCRENATNSSVRMHQGTMMLQNPQKFVTPVSSSFTRKHLGPMSKAMGLGTNLISKFDAEASIYKSNGRPSGLKRPLYEKTVVPNTAAQFSVSNTLGSGIPRLKRSAEEALTDISSTLGIDAPRKKGTTFELKRLGRRSSTSPFKMPRSSKFPAPLNCNVLSAPGGQPSSLSEASHAERRVSSHYPPQVSRIYVKDFLNVPPAHGNMEHVPEEVRLINPLNSEKYIFYDGSQSMGVEAFYQLLIRSGASMQHASKEWVANHYKWIVWKLACYERSYSATVEKKFLSISNVLEELKYRYEREVNHGQRSAIKRILEGDASPSSMLVLCVSAVSSVSGSITPGVYGTRKGGISRVQLTDGWYPIDAQLDGPLSEKLAARKLFVGQKLRICGASLNGWNVPISPLEASPTVSLVLCMNGTYRVGWAERLGFCKGACPPLAFRCVKSDGGVIPRTLVGVTRVYPMLFRERLSSGRVIVRSEKMEAAAVQLFDQRRSDVREGIVSDFQERGFNSYIDDDQDVEEGARILKILEGFAEPEYIMADMSSEELKTLANYQSKLLARRRSDMEKAIQKALEDAGLHTRDVTPFLRVRVVGLNSRGQIKEDPRDGLIRIWSPPDEQMLELAEGQAYCVSGLKPLYSDLNTLHLEAKGSSTKWRSLTKNEKECFEPFFNPRKPVQLPRIGDVPLSSEFDTVGLVVHVGQEYTAGQKKKQWVFVADGSLCKTQTEVSTVGMLAICFSSPSSENDTISLFNYNLDGSIVGLCNLVKRARDEVNQMWVADATENVAYYLNPKDAPCAHLRPVFPFVRKWQQSSYMTIEMLRQKVVRVLGCPH